MYGRALTKPWTKRVKIGLRIKRFEICRHGNKIICWMLVGDVTIFWLPIMLCCQIYGLYKDAKKNV